MGRRLDVGRIDVKVEGAKRDFLSVKHIGEDSWCDVFSPPENSGAYGQDDLGLFRVPTPEPEEAAWLPVRVHPEIRALEQHPSHL